MEFPPYSSVEGLGTGHEEKDVNVWETEHLH